MDNGRTVNMMRDSGKKTTVWFVLLKISIRIRHGSLMTHHLSIKMNLFTTFVMVVNVARYTHCKLGSNRFFFQFEAHVTDWTSTEWTHSISQFNAIMLFVVTVVLLLKYRYFQCNPSHRFYCAQFSVKPIG